MLDIASRRNIFVVPIERKTFVESRIIRGEKEAGNNCRMFECEDTSAGFHDLFLNKYADPSSAIMDFFISDSMQDMLDIDIRTEVATVVGSVSEFTSLVNDLPPSIENDNANANEDIIEPDRWLVSESKWTGTHEIYADVGACVNPNSVMPLINSSLLNSPRSQINLNTNNFQQGNSPLPSPKETKSHLTFSPNQIKIRPIEDGKRPISGAPSILAMSQASKLTAADTIKKDLTGDLKEERTVKSLINTANTPVIPATIAGGNTIKLAPGLGGLTFANGLAYTKIKQSTTDGAKIIRSNNVNIVTQIKTDNDSNSLPQKQQTITTSAMNGNIYANSGTGTPKIISRNVVISNNKLSNMMSNDIHHSSGNQMGNAGGLVKAKIKTSYHEYPKPPYSYSCLIAMALKNSRSGSLPVSEIYSFMCEHFPFFKTAPNGWKNSVRHNLSLNKCFEKIEKPATNGGQRKGCLWAMNPSKISKMDEEVQKWSRKDPTAIRQAMVCPDNLESLERGEMKHGSTGEYDGENDAPSDVEESSDLEGDLDEHITETPESIEEDEEEKYEIEVSNMYDTIDLGGSTGKETIQMALGKGEIYELTESDSPVAKKARLDINYSIAPASVFEHSMQQHQPTSSQSHQQQQQHHNRRKMQLVNRIV